MAGFFGPSLRCLKCHADSGGMNDCSKLNVIRIVLPRNAQCCCYLMSCHRQLVRGAICNRQARDHFGCPSLEGVPLEDAGDDGTRNSHLEKRIFRLAFYLLPSKTNVQKRRCTASEQRRQQQLQDEKKKKSAFRLAS